MARGAAELAKTQKLIEKTYGLCALVFGAMMAAGRNLEQYGWEVEGNPTAVGIPAICVGLIFILIPIAAGVYTLMQNKKEKVVEEVEVPPAL